MRRSSRRPARLTRLTLSRQGAAGPLEVEGNLGMSQAPEDLIRSDAASEEADICRRTLGRWFEQGKLRRFRVAGEKWAYVSRAELLSVKHPREVK